MAFGIDGNPDCGMCGMFCDWVSYPTMATETFDEADWSAGSTWNAINTATTGCPALEIKLSGETKDTYDTLSDTV
jgi:hypothetical protein